MCMWLGVCNMVWCVRIVYLSVLSGEGSVYV